MRRHGLVALLLVAGALIGAVGAAMAAGTVEYRVKAAFLYNFIKFVEWPPHAFAGPESPHTICVLGPDPFGQDLKVAAGERSPQGRPIVVRSLDDAKAAGGCHVLFIAEPDRRKLAAILASIGGAPVLTVGDHEEFIRLGGGLRFFIRDNRIRFEINLQVTDRAQLKISAKLLSLARVTGKPSKD